MNEILENKSEILNGFFEILRQNNYEVIKKDGSLCDNYLKYNDHLKEKNGITLSVTQYRKNDALEIRIIESSKSYVVCSDYYTIQEIKNINRKKNFKSLGL